MPNFRTALLASAAAIGLAGLPGLAAAQSPPTAGLQAHVMTVAVPGGGTAQIRYTGDVPPRISFTTEPAALADWAPMPALFGPDSPFAALDRISAEMDRQAAAMFRQAATLTQAAQSGQPIPAALGSTPLGSSYSVVSEMTGNGVCSQSVEITSTGNGPPKVVRHSSGNCGPAATGGTVGAAALPRAAVPGNRPDTLWIDNPAPTPYRGLIQKTALPQ